jgi:hypothetical protein
VSQVPRSISKNTSITGGKLIRVGQRYDITDAKIDG